MNSLKKDSHVCILMEDGYKNFDPGVYLNGHTWTKTIMESPVFEKLHAIKGQNNFDVYLNLCEGYDEPYYSGLEVVKALEKLNLPLTGADSGFYEPSREEMQSAAEGNGVGYARTDIRMSEAGELFVLEINPNNGILYKPEDLGPAGIMMEYDPDGHDGFLDRIFRSAILRQRERSLEN